MTEGPLNPRIEKLVAYLYGELPEAEERAFARLLEKDEGLRAEYEELRGTREILGGWELEVGSPGFVMMEEDERETRRPLAGWWSRLTGALRSPAPGFAWGVAGAAVVVLVLAVGNFRIESVERGIAFRFGEPAAEPAADAQLEELPGIGPGRPLEELAIAPGGSSRADGGGDVYLTRSEFETYTHDVLGTVATYLNDYGAERDDEVTGLIQSMYRRISQQQMREYEDLRRQIDALGVEVLFRQSQVNRGATEWPEADDGIRSLVPDPDAEFGGEE